MAFLYKTAIVRFKKLQLKNKVGIEVEMIFLAFLYKTAIVGFKKLQLKNKVGIEVEIELTKLTITGLEISRLTNSALPVSDCQTIIKSCCIESRTIQVQK